MTKSLTKFAAVSCMCLFFCPLLYGQYQGKKEDVKVLKHVLVELFDGMRQGDSAKVAAVFAPNAQMFTSYTDEKGNQVIKQGDLNKFLVAIGTPHKEVWDEKLENTDIRVDGGIAQIWTDYSFFMGSEFSHCGVDAFHLIKTRTGEWKIIHLMDTRRSDCQ